MSDNKVTYGLLNWGPCVDQLKVSDDFKNKLIITFYINFRNNFVNN